MFTFQNICADDEFKLDGLCYSLDYRPIDGDVSREQNALATANFKPHGKLYISDSFFLNLKLLYIDILILPTSVLCNSIDYMKNYIFIWNTYVLMRA